MSPIHHLYGSMQGLAEQQAYIDRMRSAREKEKQEVERKKARLLAFDSAIEQDKEAGSDRAAHDDEKPPQEDHNPGGLLGKHYA